MKLHHFAILAATLVSSHAFATTGQWDSAVAGFAGSGATSATPWIASPAAGTYYAEWNFFNGLTDDSPDIGSFGGAASVTENSGGAFVTGGGNIYSPGVTTDFTATLAGGGSGQYDVYLRLSSLGTTAATSATLNGIEATAVETYAVAITGGFGGNEQEVYWKWTLDAAPTYTFAFAASSSSMSLDQLALFAAPVPEPQTYALFGLGLGLLGLARVRRR
jgi:hypothetical protein